ncbi:type I restriction enzyme, S subunit [Vibrio crassostreae]|uniref:restriction endonuclease subunit S n=1 Tax=Vibrio crassostreae TaxID=246167 RepID=UPI0010F1E042|nr:restriction endonuclease subunit S [Vibrio crassostreae]TCN85082.1 type I restriction enzyme S subunit [Vibrio crassostreae]CAK2405868.1 type I restriction enzyme, S subunit [Vibrio crassostreae]CAK3751442.1 type I restriction enzyme, S subunit [Vibrio crassostreae]
MNSLTSMATHNEYTDSGISWLGSIPSHWEGAPLCSVSKLKSITNHVDEPLLSVYLDKGVIRFDEVEAKRTNATSLDLSKYQLVEPGDFVLNNQQAWRGSVGVSAHRGIVSPAYLVLQLSSKIYPRFGNYLFRDGSMVANYLVNSKGVGTIQRNLYWPQLKRALVFFPGFDEQIAIANYLDEKTSQIDEAVVIKQKQIELLKERKQIIIQKAVTQGLKSNNVLVETDLIWAPQIASHWSLLPNRLFLKIRRVPVGSAHKNYQMLSLTKKGVLIRDLSKGAGKQSDFLERMQEVRKGDFIFCLFDVEETPRTVGLSKHLGMISADYTIFECSDEYTGRFLEYYYKSMDDQKLLKPLYKGLRNRIPKPRFLRTNCPMPPKGELIEIVMYLDTLEEKTTRSIDIILSQIEKLKEYKTTLINSAVTGKIKVTELV